MHKHFSLYYLNFKVFLFEVASRHATSRGRPLKGTNKKIDNLMKKMFLDAIVLVLHICYCFFFEKQICKSPKWGRPQDVYETQLTSWGPDDGTFWGRPWDVGHTCFLNSTQKHI